MHPTKKIMVYPTRQIDYAHILKIPITKTQHSRQHMLNISDRQSRGGSTGGASSPQLLGTIHSAWCLTAVGNRCGHKKKNWGMCPPPPPPPRSTCLYKTRQTAHAYKAQRIRQAAHAYKTHVSERQHMLTKPMYQRGSTCLQNPCIREAAHAYKTQHIRQA